jgi:hypothetical protein
MGCELPQLPLPGGDRRKPPHRQESRGACAMPCHSARSAPGLLRLQGRLGGYLARVGADLLVISGDRRRWGRRCSSGGSLLADLEYLGDLLGEARILGDIKIGQLPNGPFGNDLAIVDTCPVGDALFDLTFFIQDVRCCRGKIGSHTNCLKLVLYGL